MITLKQQLRSCLLCICFLFLSLSSGASALISAQSHTVKLPKGSYTISPYVSEHGAWLHLQPKEHGSELLFDAINGMSLSQPPDTFKNSTRLDFVEANEVGYLKNLGCNEQYQGCTVIEDDYRLIFVSFSAEDLKLIWRVVDLRPLINSTRNIFAGKSAAIENFFSNSERQLIEYAVKHSNLRERILDDIETIDSLSKLTTFQDSRRNLNLCTWTSFTCSDKAGAYVDLRKAEEKQLIKIYAKLLVSPLFEKSNSESNDNFIRFLLKISAPPFPAGDGISYAVEEIRKFPPLTRNKVADELLKYKGVDKSNIYCFADWIRDKPCEPTNTKQEINSATASKNLIESSSPIKESIARSKVTISTSAPTILPVAKASISVADEYIKVLNHPNPTRLLTIDETSGVLLRDSKSIGGIVFTAKAVGSVSEGRFEILAKVSEDSDIPIRVGSYRVRIDLNLNYLREDICLGALRCIFANDNKVSKSENRETIFNLSPDNNWRATNKVSFGHLLPLNENTGGLYKSSLKDVRLSIKKSAWSLK
jgi:hypothetical protein